MSLRILLDSLEKFPDICIYKRAGDSLILEFSNKCNDSKKIEFFWNDFLDMMKRSGYQYNNTDIIINNKRSIGEYVLPCITTIFKNQIFIKAYSFVEIPMKDQKFVFGRSYWNDKGVLMTMKNNNHNNFQYFFKDAQLCMVNIAILEDCGLIVTDIPTDFEKEYRMEKSFSDSTGIHEVTSVGVWIPARIIKKMILYQV